MSKGMTVGQLVAALKKCPQDARVKFLDTDDPERTATVVEDADTVEHFLADLGLPPAETEEVRSCAELEDDEVVIVGS